MAVIEAILAAKRQPEYLASLIGSRVKKLRQEIANALQGWWREELLFELGVCLDFYRLYEGKIKECDGVIEKFLLKYYGLETHRLKTEAKAI